MFLWNRMIFIADEAGSNKYDREDIADVFAEFYGELHTSATKTHEHEHEGKWFLHQFLRLFLRFFVCVSVFSCFFGWSLLLLALVLICIRVLLCDGH